MKEETYTVTLKLEVTINLEATNKLNAQIEAAEKVKEALKEFETSLLSAKVK